jgi:hypothetical protein
MTETNEPDPYSAPEQQAAESAAVYLPKPNGSGIPLSEDVSVVMTRMLFRQWPKSTGLFARFKRRGPESGT